MNFYKSVMSFICSYLTTFLISYYFLISIYKNRKISSEMSSYKSIITKTIAQNVLKHGKAKTTSEMNLY